MKLTKNVVRALQLFTERKQPEVRPVLAHIAARATTLGAANGFILLVVPQETGFEKEALLNPDLLLRAIGPNTDAEVTLAEGKVTVVARDWQCWFLAPEGKPPIYEKLVPPREGDYRVVGLAPLYLKAIADAAMLLKAPWVTFRVPADIGRPVRFDFGDDRGTFGAIMPMHIERT